ncbi:DUF3530 family protein [Pseudoteredinibacter isoporae]|uniref:DUF3530 family protein n=1 Tax=Pseudoteredinibacter isoporae TaxID=570281 RepID=UPI003107EEA2
MIRRNPLSLSISLLFAVLSSNVSHGQEPSDSAATAQTQETQTQETQTQEPQTSTPEDPETITRPSLDKQHLAQEKMAALAKEVDPESLLWLGEGAERFLAVYQEAWRPLPYGAAIVLHRDGQHPRWPQTSQVLSDNLAKHGWTSLAISLPPSLPQAIPERPIQNTTPDDTQGQNGPAETNESQAKTPEETQGAPQGNGAPMAAEETNPSMIDPETQAYERLMEAYEYLRQQGLLNIAIICEGQSVVRAVKMIADIPVSPPSNPQAQVAKPIAALVSINAVSHIPNQSDFNLAKAMADLDLYVLDIYFEDGEKSQQLAQQRKAYALRAGLPVYRQQQLPLPSSKLALGENPMSKRVRGFLNRYAKGRAKTLR